MLKFDVMAVGMLQVNTYILWHQESKQGYIVDPGAEAERIVARVRQLGVEPVAVLLTHGHVDHISAVGAVAGAFGVPVVLHPDEVGLYSSPKNALEPWVPAAKNLPQTVAHAPMVPGLTMQVIHTPGHTRGGVCYYFPEAAALFSGDTLFQNSIGRTDLSGGNLETLLSSIRTRLLTLPAETRVFPGHGSPSSIGAEQRGNPYIQPAGA